MIMVANYTGNIAGGEHSVNVEGVTRTERWVGRPKVDVTATEKVDSGACVCSAGLAVSLGGRW
jgi:hypothetical protein